MKILITALLMLVPTVALAHNLGVEHTHGNAGDHIRCQVGRQLAIGKYQYCLARIEAKRFRRGKLENPQSAAGDYSKCDFRLASRWEDLSTKYSEERCEFGTSISAESVMADEKYTLWKRGVRIFPGCGTDEGYCADYPEGPEECESNFLESADYCGNNCPGACEGFRNWVEYGWCYLDSNCDGTPDVWEPVDCIFHDNDPACHGEVY